MAVRPYTSYKGNAVYYHKKKYDMASLSLFYHCFQAESALRPLSVSVHLKTTKLTYLLNMCSQSAIILIYTCGKYSEIYTIQKQTTLLCSYIL